MSVGQPRAFKGSLYRPLTVLSFALNYAWGDLNPQGYHVVNLLLHIGVVLLIGLLALQLGLGSTGAWAAALVFAVLPIHTEAVSNLVGRSEILAAFFVLLSWLCATGRPSGFRIFAGAICFALAMLSKESAAAFFGALVASDAALSKRSLRDTARERAMVWIAYFGTLFLYLEWRYLIIGSVTDTGSVPYFTDQHPLVILLTMAEFVMRHYFVPLVTGLGLCADYTRPQVLDASPANLVAWSSALVFIGIVLYALIGAMKNKNLAALSILLLFILLFPVSNLWIRLEVIGAERFLYLPSIGYALIVGFLFEKAIDASKAAAWASGLFFAAICLWYGTRTFERNKVWQTESTFFGPPPSKRRREVRVHGTVWVLF